MKKGIKRGFILGIIATIVAICIYRYKTVQDFDDFDDFDEDFDDFSDLDEE